MEVLEEVFWLHLSLVYSLEGWRKEEQVRGSFEGSFPGPGQRMGRLWRLWRPRLWKDCCGGSTSPLSDWVLRKPEFVSKGNVTCGWEECLISCHYLPWRGLVAVINILMLL